MFGCLGSCMLHCYWHDAMVWTSFVGCLATLEIEQGLQKMILVWLAFEDLDHEQHQKHVELEGFGECNFGLLGGEVGHELDLG